jgi:hypothetical protein
MGADDVRHMESAMILLRAMATAAATKRWAQVVNDAKLTPQ